MPKIATMVSCLDDDQVPAVEAEARRRERRRTPR
jgi:hypothetical protein